MFVIPQLVSIEGCSLILFCGVPHKDACMLSDEQARQTFSFCFPELLFHNKELLVGHWGQSFSHSQHHSRVDVQLTDQFSA